MQDKGFPVYQWSVMSKNGKEIQYVVRENDFAAFKTACTNVMALIGETTIHTEEKVVVVPPSSPEKPVEQPTVNMSAPTCNMHGAQMKERHAQNGGTYWDHREKDDQGNWRKCNGTGWKY